eukprot:3980565-Prymnesium_polylepis.1
MADPAPVAQTFFVDDMVKSFARLDGIVTLVDAKHIEQVCTRRRGAAGVSAAGCGRRWRGGGDVRCRGKACAWVARCTIRCAPFA